MADLLGTTPGAVSAYTHDPAEAWSIGRSVYHPHELLPSPSSTPFEMRLRAASLGPLTVGILGYSDEVRIDADPFETSYQVNIPLTGILDCWTGTERVVAGPSTGVIFGPHATTSFSGFADGGALLGIKIDRAALDSELATLTGQRCGATLPSIVDLSSGRGAEWWSMARSLVDLLGAPDGLITNPLVTRPLARAVIVGLLVALDAPTHASPSASSVTTPTVRRAAELLEARAADALTVTDLAAETGASVRTLQAGFRRDLGTTPMEYLRTVRLARAHADLVAADPTEVTVGEVARRWASSTSVVSRPRTSAASVSRPPKRCAATVDRPRFLATCPASCGSRV